MTMSSLVQRQSERQGIFLIALSPFKRGAEGVKYQPLFLPLPHPCHSVLRVLPSLKTQGGIGEGFIFKQIKTVIPRSAPV